jgi:hypothetical protein
MKILLTLFLLFHILYLSIVLMNIFFIWFYNTIEETNSRNDSIDIINYQKALNPIYLIQIIKKF